MYKVICSEEMRKLAGFMIVSDLIKNVEDTWKSPAVMKNKDKFIEKATSWLEGLKKRFNVAEIARAISTGTGGQVKLNPAGELI